MTPSLRETEHAFVAELRSPKAPSSRGAKLYQTLFRENYYSLIAPCFPVARQIIGLSAFKDKVFEFFMFGRSQSPYFNELATAFVQFWQEKAEELPYPFLADLMHYEWLEMVLQCLDEDEVVNKQPLSVSDFEHKCFKLSSLARLQAYHYPVDRIGVSFKPALRENTYLLLQRNSEHQVTFTKLNPLIYDLLQALSEKRPIIEAILGLYQTKRNEKADGVTTKEHFIESAIKTLNHFYLQNTLIL